MKKYTRPQIDEIDLTSSDIITASPGTETDPQPDNGGIWDLDIG